MRTMGIDIGSRSIKVAYLAPGAAPLFRTGDTGHDPLGTCRLLMADLVFDSLVVTGYGRDLARSYLGGQAITEIRALAVGARHLYPDCRSILDIGGQDTKALSLEPDGKLGRFEMNDRCAAGTGRFLESMALALGLTLEDFILEAARATVGEKINSLCAVFAESEVVSLVTRGVPRESVALGIHLSMASRSATLLHRIGVTKPVLFTGGPARNACLVASLSATLGFPLVIPESPHTVAALGAALWARQTGA